MSELSLPVCPICHAKDSLSRQTMERAGQPFVWYECRECGSVLLWLGDDRWAYQKIGHEDKEHLLKQPMTPPVLSALAVETKDAVLAAPAPPIREPLSLPSAKSPGTSTPWHQGRILTLLGALGLLGGALLPWVSAATIVGTLTFSGYQGDGLFSGGIGLLLLIGAIVSKGKPGHLYSVATSIFALLAGVLVVNAWVKISSVIPQTLSGEGFIHASVGVGMYVSVAGAIVSIIGGLLRVPE